MKCKSLTLATIEVLTVYSEEKDYSYLCWKMCLDLLLQVSILPRRQLVILTNAWIPLLSTQEETRIKNFTNARASAHGASKESQCVIFSQNHHQPRTAPLSKNAPP